MSYALTGKPCLWSYSPTAHALCLTPQDTHYRTAFTFVGWLMGQSLLNRAPLNVNFPALLFRQVLHQATLKEGFKPNLEMLQQYDPHAAAAIRNVANLPKAQLADMPAMEVTEGLTVGKQCPKKTVACFLTPSQLADMLAMEGSEGLTVEQYQQKALNDLLVGATKWQAEALSEGLLRVLGTELASKWCLGPEALAMAVAGTEGEESSVFPYLAREERESRRCGNEVVGLPSRGLIMQMFKGMSASCTIKWLGSLLVRNEVNWKTGCNRVC
eukprot:1155735-Pelagomonas_calceolata.AAC.12